MYSISKIKNQISKIKIAESLLCSEKYLIFAIHILIFDLF